MLNQELTIGVKNETTTKEEGEIMVKRSQDGREETHREQWTIYMDGRVNRKLR